MRNSLIFLFCVLTYLAVFHVQLIAYEKPIVILVLAYNHEDFYERNLNSIISQKYENYRVIFIDDCSCDNTYYHAKAYCADQKILSRIKFIRSESHQGPISHMYREVQKCKDDEIIVFIAGCDWFADSQTLSIINSHYCTSDIWLSYGAYTCYPHDNHSSMSKTLKSSMQELCTCYAWLFKELKLEDLLNNHIFYTLDWNSVITEPLKRLACTRCRPIKTILYVRNTSNTIIRPVQSDKPISCPLNNYIPIHQPRIKKSSTEPEASILIFSTDPSHLVPLLVGIKGYLVHHATIDILYPADVQTDAAYQTLIAKFSSINFIRYETHNFKSALTQYIEQVPYTYIMLSNDTCKPISPVDLQICTQALNNTNLDIFYLPIGRIICPYGMALSQEIACIDTGNQIYAWASSNKNGHWLLPILQMTLFSKSYLSNVLDTARVSSPEDLHILLHRTIVQENKLGLMFDQMKVI